MRSVHRSLPIGWYSSRSKKTNLHAICWSFVQINLHLLLATVALSEQSILGFDLHAVLAELWVIRFSRSFSVKPIKSQIAVQIKHLYNLSCTCALFGIVGKPSLVLDPPREWNMSPVGDKGMQICQHPGVILALFSSLSLFFKLSAACQMNLSRLCL